MSDLSARLGLPYLMPAQAQKHVTHNEALAHLDLLVQLVVQGFDATEPPKMVWLPPFPERHQPGLFIQFGRKGCVRLKAL